jgi:DNA-directed RNA polymerase subunit RPC12/RpoP
MRNLVEPLLPSTHCEHCGGELLFKDLETDNPALDIEVQIFVCSKCGREHSHKLIHEPYTAHTARDAGAGTVAQPHQGSG